MAEHPIHNLMKISMENIKQMVDVDTIVGNPVKTENGETIIPFEASISYFVIIFTAGGIIFILYGGSINIILNFMSSCPSLVITSYESAFMHVHLSSNLRF